MGFFEHCHQEHRQLKHSTKCIYLHSSSKEAQLSTVHFFWDWVYIVFWYKLYQALLSLVEYVQKTQACHTVFQETCFMHNNNYQFCQWILYWQMGEQIHWQNINNPLLHCFTNVPLSIRDFRESMCLLIVSSSPYSSCFNFSSISLHLVLTSSWSADSSICVATTQMIGATTRDVTMSYLSMGNPTLNVWSFTSINWVQNTILNVKYFIFKPLFKLLFDLLLSLTLSKSLISLLVNYHDIYTYMVWLPSSAPYSDIIG